MPKEQQAQGRKIRRRSRRRRPADDGVAADAGHGLHRAWWRGARTPAKKQEFFCDPDVDRRTGFLALQKTTRTRSAHDAAKACGKDLAECPGQPRPGRAEGRELSNQGIAELPRAPLALPEDARRWPRRSARGIDDSERLARERSALHPPTPRGSWKGRRRRPRPPTGRSPPTDALKKAAKGLLPASSVRARAQVLGPGGGRAGRRPGRGSPPDRFPEAARSYLVEVRERAALGPATPDAPRGCRPRSSRRSRPRSSALEGGSPEAW